MRLKIFCQFVILKILKILYKAPTIMEWSDRLQYMCAIGYYKVNMRLYALKQKDVQNVLNKNQVVEYFVSCKHTVLCKNIQVNQHIYKCFHIYIKLKIRILDTTVKKLIYYRQVILFILIIVFKCFNKYFYDLRK